MKQFLGLIVAVLMLAWASSSCKDEITDADVSQIVFPDSNVRYGLHVQPLFNLACGGQNSFCHGVETYWPSGFSLDSYEHLMFGDRRVIFPGEPDASPLILSIEGTTTPRMPPPNFPQLNTNQIRGLRQWVKEGARSD